MDSDRWKKIRAIYLEAIDLDAAEREAFVRGQCGDDRPLADEVIALLEVPTRSVDTIDGIVHDATADATPELVGERRVGPYRLLEIIGQGGMGQVYLAERADQQFEQQVAIKMANWVGATDELLQRFRQERQILAHLEHPNIARLLDGGQTDDGQPYLAMEYVEGESILDYGQSTQHSIHDRLQLFLKICGAVQYAHSKLVIHRDIKPSNVLVTVDGIPKLLDFGIAKLLDSGVDVTRADARMLTPEYASPEQLTGAPVTTATDIYGLGMLLYQLLSGSLPFDLSSSASPQIRELICNTEPEIPSAMARQSGNSHRAAGLRGELDNIVMMALRKDPLRRYATVKDFADDVRNFLANKPVVARGDGWAYRSRKFLQRNRVAVLATGLIVSLTAAQTVFYTSELAAERDNALAERQVAESTTEFLVDLFNVSNPGESLGETITAREVLDQGAVRIRNELKDDDAIRARMLQTIGRVYERLGLYDPARELMQEAVELNRRTLDTADRTYIDGLDELAWLHYRQENWQAAFNTASESLELQRAAAGGDDASMARTLNHLGTITYYLDDYDASLGFYERALAALDTPDMRDSDLRGTTLNHMGIVYATLARFDEAEAAYTESLDIRLRVLGQQHPDTATAYANLGAFYNNTGEFDKAMEFATKGLEIDRATKGDEHVDVAFDLNLLGSTAIKSGDAEAALRYVQEAVEIWRTAAGPTHSRYARALDTLASIYLKLERYQESIDVGNQSLSILRDNYGEDHTMTADPHYTLGTAHYAAGRPVEAREHFNRALDIRLAAFGDAHTEVWNVQYALAKIERDEGNHTAALTLSRQIAVNMEAASLTELPLFESVQAFVTALSDDPA